MDDLIEQLRDESKEPLGFPRRPKSRSELVVERHKAAERIEELEAALAKAEAKLATIEAETLERVAVFIREYGPSDDIGNNDAASAIRNLKNKDTGHDRA